MNDYLTTTHPPIFDLEPVVLDDLCKIINKMKSSQSCSIDGITSSLLKAANNEKSPVLDRLFNLSITRSFSPTNGDFLL